LNEIEFKKIIEENEKTENFRGTMWYRAKELLRVGYKTEAYILLLATWNFARFRYFMTTFDLKKFEKTIEDVQPIFDKLKDETFEKANFNNLELQNDIKTIYKKLKEIVEQTGTSKLMALTNPNLFVMWDTKIREKYNINDKARPEDYFQFLINMQNRFKDIKWERKDKSLAKAIDEFNYLTAHEIFD